MLGRDFFQLFKLPKDYHVDPRVLDDIYHQFQETVAHDTASGSESLVRSSVQESNAMNEAYVTLKCPYKRGEYMLFLLGEELDDTGTTREADRSFVMTLMNLKSELEHARENKDAHHMLIGMLGKLSLKVSEITSRVAEEFSLETPDIDLLHDNLIKLKAYIDLQEEAQYHIDNLHQ